MKDLTKETLFKAFALTPIVAYAAYKLSLEIWCIAYSLIY